MEIKPFLLEPVLKPKPWGGRALERLLGRSLPEGEGTGESWELCARPGDSNRIASGPLAGRTLLEAIEAYPVEILGPAVVARYGNRLPVLAKFIDANDWLSVQVHPDDCSAESLSESDSGKEEAWLVIEARPGATLILGTRYEIPFEKLIELCEQGRHVDCLNYVSVEAGDVLAIPPGTLHAIGGGIVLFEVSQNSDVTYRVDDWNRNSPGRQLHREKARQVLTCGPPVKAKQVPERGGPLTVLHESGHFRFGEILPAGEPVMLEGGSFASITVMDGGMSIEAGDSVLDLNAGMTAFVPACVTGSVLTGSGRAVLVEPVENA